MQYQLKSCILFVIQGIRIFTNHEYYLPCMMIAGKMQGTKNSSSTRRCQGATLADETPVTPAPAPRMVRAPGQSQPVRPGSQITRGQLFCDDETRG